MILNLVIQDGISDRSGILFTKRQGVRYHEVHIYRLLHKWGFKPKVPQKRFVNTVSTKEKKKFKKE